MKSFDDLFEQLLTALQTTEKRHRAVRDSASDNSDWITYDSEGALISSIIKWRRGLEQYRTEIIASAAVVYKDIPTLPTLIMENQLLPVINTYNELAQADVLSRSDDERIGHYIWHEMKDIKWFDSLLQTQTIVPYDKLISRKIEYEDSIPTAAKTDVKQDTVQTEFITIHTRQQTIGDNIVKVSSSFVPVLIFPEKNIVIAAKLIVNTKQVSFRAEVNGVPYPEKILDIDYLKKIALLENSKRIHKITVPENVNTSKKMMFMAWINPLELGAQEALQELDPTEPESSAAKTKPTYITLFGKEYPVGAWNEMYIKVCEVMLLHNPYEMAALDRDAEFNTEQRTNFSYIRSDIKYNGKRLSNGLWVETNMDSQATLKKCHKLLEKCGFTPDELQVETMEVA